MKYMQLRSTLRAHSHRFIYVVGWIWSSKLHSTLNSAVNLELSRVLLYCICLSRWLGMSGLGISANKSADKSSLQDWNKQQRSFFLICFPEKYSDRLVATVR